MKSKPILTSMFTKHGKVCVYTEKAESDRGQGYLVALDFMSNESSDYTRLTSEFITRGDVQKYGGLKAIRNRILDKFSRGQPTRESSERFRKALFSQ